MTQRSPMQTGTTVYQKTLTEVSMPTLPSPRDLDNSALHSIKGDIITNKIKNPNMFMPRKASYDLRSRQNKSTF